MNYLLEAVQIYFYYQGYYYKGHFNVYIYFFINLCA